MTEAFSVIFTTAGSRSEADRIAEALVSRRLAACVQISEVASTYRWNGQVTHEVEHLLLIKTAARMYKEVEAAIQELHSYEIPEIVQLPIEQGLDPYLNWVDESTR
ncbi:MAG: divalent-cation tolerance protein CutA [Anaerolineales bacterium]|jgi:periplasmic divalent cation tolerance protein